MNDIKQILEGVKAGDISVENALQQLKLKPFEDLGYAKVDLHRRVIQGQTEVIYGAGKTPEQIAGIARSLVSNGQSRVIITRISHENIKNVAFLMNLSLSIRDSSDKNFNVKGVCEDGIFYDAISQMALLGGLPLADGLGNVLVASAGTSDIPVAEEAALTAQAMGNNVIRTYDMGVAGLHRTLANLDDITSAAVIIAVAGMEGALASVVGGLADCPVIAVPTSVGYGASFGGISALLSMLNSCASGVSVVNIDNGFGAGYLASMINHPDVSGVLQG